MDDSDQSINPNAPQAPNASSDRLSQEARVRLALQRKFSLSDEATLLSEKTTNPRNAHRARRFLIFMLLMLGVGTLALWGVNRLFIPRLLSALPTILHSPYQELSSYKRTIKGLIDYYPPLVLSSKKIGISEFDHGASFSIVSSATVIPHKGLEGVLRLDLEKTKTTAAASDIDLGYKVLFSQGKQDMGVYFFFNHWPSYLEALGLSGDSRGEWFGYDSNAAGASKEDVDALMSFLNPENNHVGTQHFITALWHAAAEQGALQWKIEHFLRSLPDGTQVADIRFAIDPEKFETALTQFVKDPLYIGDVRAVGEAPVAGTTVVGLLRSIRSLSGRMTIGIWDRRIHELTGTFDINDKSAGTYRGTITSSFDIIQTKKEIAKPEQSKSAVDILSLFAVDAGDQASMTATTTDSDSDGLSDSAEEQYHTNPLVTDTDKDGFSDGDEVKRGFDPAGSGKLKK